MENIMILWLFKINNIIDTYYLNVYTSNLINLFILFVKYNEVEFTNFYIIIISIKSKIIMILAPLFDIN